MIQIKSQEQFDQDVLKSSMPVMVDFFADWCGPCQALAPLLEEMDSEAETYCIAEVNVDDLPELAMTYHVASVPTVLVFKEGACVERSVGLVGREELEALI